VLRTRIKICGITCPGDAREAAFAGVDAIGLVFYPPSPRAVDIERARNVVADLPPFVSLVGLFVNADRQQVQRTCAALPLDVLQFHGEETESYCRSFDRPYLKAIRVAAETDVARQLEAYPGASALLLDTYRAGVPGGTGETFDWRAVPRSAASRCILAGGLTPDNVGAAIAQTSVYGVDVSGGVESAPGQKSAGKIHAFVHAVREADIKRVGSIPEREYD
jgi:phosphoribosylanthranilate isomerase